MVKTFTLVAGSTLSAQANVQVEVDWDYAYLIASSDGGAARSRVQVAQTIVSTENANANFPPRNPPDPNYRNNEPLTAPRINPCGALKDDR